MPSPKDGEKRKDFIYRCMSSQESINTFPDSRQRAAFCYSQWSGMGSSEQEQKKRDIRQKRNVSKSRKPSRQRR
jgi:hypothetical protein